MGMQDWAPIDKAQGLVCYTVPMPYDFTRISQQNSHTFLRSLKKNTVNY